CDCRCPRSVATFFPYTTLFRSRRGRVLAAKAVVLGAIAFAAGLVAAAIVIPVGERLLHANGNPIPPLPALTWLQVLAGTAALLRSEEHTSELQSRENLVCRPLL